MLLVFARHPQRASAIIGIIEHAILISSVDTDEKVAQLNRASQHRRRAEGVLLARQREREHT